MTVKQLNKTQLRQLKETYYTDKHEYVSWSELERIEDLVSDDEVFSFYGNTLFVEEDFWG